MSRGGRPERDACCLAEGEGVGLDAGVEEGDLEGALADRARLADELVEPRLGEDAVALVVDVAAVGAAGGSESMRTWNRTGPPGVVGARTRRTVSAAAAPTIARPMMPSAISVRTGACV